MNPVVEALVCRLDDAMREAFEERAGILQFEAGRERELAEALALLDVIRMNPLVVASIVVLQGEIGGDPVVVLATEKPTALARLQALGVTGASIADLPWALHGLGGLARLTPLDARTPEN